MWNQTISKFQEIKHTINTSFQASSTEKWAWEARKQIWAANEEALLRTTRTAKRSQEDSKVPAATPKKESEIFEKLS